MATLKPRHPNEPALHATLRDALNRKLTNTDFFVLIHVRPTGERHDFGDLSSIVEGTEDWLSSLDPDEVRARTERHFADAAADVRITAVPKKPEARSVRADEIVGNPEPVVAGWFGE